MNACGLCRQSLPFHETADLTFASNSSRTLPTFHLDTQQSLRKGGFRQCLRYRSVLVDRWDVLAARFIFLPDDGVSFVTLDLYQQGERLPIGEYIVRQINMLTSQKY